MRRVCRLAQGCELLTTTGADLPPHSQEYHVEQHHQQTVLTLWQTIEQLTREHFPTATEEEIIALANEAFHKAVALVLARVPPFLGGTKN